MQIMKNKNLKLRNVSLEDLLCDVENSEPRPEPTPKLTRTVACLFHS